MPEPVMVCPGCGQAMIGETLDGHYGRRVTLDLCHGCGAFWFDPHESSALTPGAVLRLFVRINEHQAERQGGPRPTPTCPRCRRRLVLTSDLQRNTRFHYWRCADDHGRFISFAEFLREKHFVRPLDPAELAELRAKVKTVRCSSCGAPVDLEQGSTCGYCRAPVSALDTEQVERVVEELRRAEEKRTTVDPTLPVRLAADRLEVDRLFRRLERPAGWSLGLDAPGLVGTGIAAIAELLAPTEARDD